MPISVGEVTATLRFQVAQQALRDALANLTRMQDEFRAAGGAATTAGQQIQQSMNAAQQQIEKLQALVTSTKLEMDNLAGAGKSSMAKVKDDTDAASESVSQLDRLAVRMVERLALFYALRGAVQFTEDIFESADALNHLSNSTDLSIRTLQEWQYAGAQTDVPATKLSAAIETLHKNLAEMKPGASDGLNEIGLSFEKIFAMNPDQQLKAIATGIESIQSPAERARVEIELFGTDAIDPLIKKYSELSAAADKSGLPSEDTVRVLSNAVTQMKAFTLNLADYGAEALASGIKFTSGILSPLFALKEGGVEAWKIAIAETYGYKAAVDATAKSLPLPPLMGQAYIDSLRTGIQLTDQQKVLLAQLNALHELTLANAARAAGVTTAQYKAYVGELQEAKKAAEEHMQEEKHAAEEAKKWAEVMDDLNSAGTGWKGTLESIDGEVKEAVKYYLEAGVSQQALAKAYGLTQAQVKAVATELSEEVKEQKRAAEVARETATMEAEVYAKLSATVSDYESTTLQKKLAANERAYEDAVAKAQAKGVTDENYYNALFALMEKENAIARKNVSDETKYSREHYEQMYQKAKEAYDAIMAHVEDHTAKEIEMARKEMMEKEKMSIHWRDQAVKDIDDVEKKDEEKTSKAISNARKQAEQSKSATDSGGGSGRPPGPKSGEETKAESFSTQYDLSTPEGRSKVDPKIAKWLHDGYSLAQASALAFDEAWGIMPNPNDPLFQTKGPRVPGFATGITNFEGGLARVHEGELLVNLPKGTDVVPAAAADSMGGGGMQNNTFHIHTYAPRDQMVRQITDEIIKNLKSVQKFKNA